jgi:hypothetical protein
MTANKRCHFGDFYCFLNEVILFFKILYIHNNYWGLYGCGKIHGILVGWRNNKKKKIKISTNLHQEIFKQLRSEHKTTWQAVLHT